MILFIGVSFYDITYSKKKKTIKEETLAHFYIDIVLFSKAIMISLSLSF